jgi:hypothetical protein
MFSVNYYVTLLSEQVVQEGIGDDGHLHDLSGFYKNSLAPLANDPNVSADDVYGIIVNEMSKYNGHGISPQNFNKFKKELDGIKRSWDAGQPPPGGIKYKSPQENMISYVGYWLTSGMVGSANKYERKPDITRGNDWINAPSGNAGATAAPTAAHKGHRASARSFGESRDADVNFVLRALNEEDVTAADIHAAPPEGGAGDEMGMDDGVGGADDGMGDHSAGLDLGSMIADLDAQIMGGGVDPHVQSCWKHSRGPMTCRAAVKSRRWMTAWARWGR